MTTLLGILGSVTPPGRLLSALGAAMEMATEADSSVSTGIVNLADYKISFADGRPLDQLTDDTAEVVARVERASAVILASPVYRSSFTGAMKNLLDLLPVESLRGKVCGIIAMGATNHHYLGVDWQLRAVLAWFGALPVPTSVYLVSADFTGGEISKAARDDLRALIEAVLAFDKGLSVKGASQLGPPPLSSRQS